MSNILYLIRHGQDYDNSKGILNGHRDQTLTPAGIDQAINLGQKIKEKQILFDFVLSSPLNRTFTTASIVSSIGGFPTPIPEPLLIERDFGIMTGQPQSKIIEMCSPEILQTNTITYFLSPKGSESFPDLITRANKLLAKIENTYQDKSILLASHGDFGKMFFATYYKLDWKTVLSQFHFGNSEMLKLSSDTVPDNSKIISMDQLNS